MAVLRHAYVFCRHPALLALMVGVSLLALPSAGAFAADGVSGADGAPVSLVPAADQVPSPLPEEDEAAAPSPLPAGEGVVSAPAPQPVPQGEPTAPADAAATAVPTPAPAPVAGAALPAPAPAPAADVAGTAVEVPPGSVPEPSADLPMPGEAPSAATTTLPDLADVPAPAKEEKADAAPAAKADAEEADAAETDAAAASAEKKIQYYYDGGPDVPAITPLQGAGPRKVDPSKEPGSRYVVVKKTFEGDSGESVLATANRALKMGRYDSALDFYEQLYRQNPRDPRVLMGKAVALQKLGKLPAATSAYEELLEVEPRNPEALVNLMGIVNLQYPSVALQKLLDLRDKYPRHAGIAAQVGLTYAGMGRADEALKYMGIAAALEPNNPLHYFNLAVVLDKNKNRAKAMEMYEKALEVDAIHGNGTAVSRQAIYDRLAVLRSR